MRFSIGKSVVALAAVGGVGAGGGAAVGASTSESGSRLDDGKQYLSRAEVSEQQAIVAAQGAASGGLNEVDLEYRDGRLCWNVDVGDKDVKVDAKTGKVVDAGQGD